MSTEDPTLLTPESIMILSRVGREINIILWTLLPELALFGVYCTLSLVTVYFILKTSTNRKFWSLLVVLITTLLITLDCVMRILHFKGLIDIALLDEGTTSLEERRLSHNDWVLGAQFLTLCLWFCPSSSGSIGLLFIITDIVTCWRAKVISTCGTGRDGLRGRMLRLAMWLFVLLAFALWVAHSGISTHAHLSGVPDPESEVASTIAVLVITASVASIAANLLATGIIGYEAWQHLRSASALKLKPLRGASILLFLTESGIFHAVVQVVRLALTLSVDSSSSSSASKSDPLYIASMTFSSVTNVNVVAAMYTPAVLLIVNFGLSFADNVRLTTGELISTIEFKNGQIGTAGTGKNACGSPTASGSSLQIPSGDARMCSSDSISGWSDAKATVRSSFERCGGVVYGCGDDNEQKISGRR